jgi:GPI mannosyltransferase 3
MPNMRRFMLLLALAALITRLAALALTHGMVESTFDNHYQILEPAHKLVFGYGITSVEWESGLRSWLQPLIAAAIFKSGMALGLSDISQLIFLNRAFMTLSSLALLYVIYAMAHGMYGERGAQWALFFAVFSGTLWLWSADTSSNLPVTLLITSSLATLWGGLNGKSGRGLPLSGAALGLAFVFRADSLLFILPIILYAAWSRRLRALLPFAGGLAAILLFGGLLDTLTWGSFMHSSVAFFSHNLIEGKNQLFGTMPPIFYIAVLALHLTCLFVIPHSIERKPQTVYLLANITVPLLILSAIPHKEARFIMPIMPLIFILAGRGMERAAASYGRLFAASMTVATIALSISYVAVFGFGSHGATFDSMRYVGSQEDSTGVAYTMPWFQSGTYTYLHKRIPAVYVADATIDPTLVDVKCRRPDMAVIGFQCSPWAEVQSERRINYLVAQGDQPRTTPDGFALVRDFGGVLLYKRI